MKENCSITKSAANACRALALETVASAALHSAIRQYSHRCNNACVRIKQSNLHYAANACARVHLYIVPLRTRVCPQPLATQELII